MQRYEWHGSGPVHTPDGVRGPDNRKPFVASLGWIASHRKWVQAGLVTPVVEKSKKRRSKK